MRVEQLTFTRFLAAISIVAYHFGLDVFPFNHYSISFLFSQANICVSYFFILSGFVMMIAYGKKNHISFLKFMQSRFARLYPVYLLALLFYLWTTRYYHFGATKIILSVFIVQSWVPEKALSLNYPSWALSVEIFFYAIFPFIFNQFYSKKSFKKIAITVIAVFIISQTVFHLLIHSSFYTPYASKNHDLLYYFPFMHLNAFLVGNLAGLFFIRNNKSGNYDIPIIFCVGLIALSLKYNSLLNFHDGSYAVFFVPLLIFMSRNNGYITKIFSKKIFGFLGETSYCIYILQVPVFYYGRHIFYERHIYNSSTIFYSSLIALLIIAIAVYLLIEMPLRNLINKIKITPNAPLNNN